MRHIALHTPTRSEVALPRGWIVLAGALASWAVFALMGVGMSQLFGLIASGI